MVATPKRRSRSSYSPVTASLLLACVTSICIIAVALIKPSLVSINSEGGFKNDIVIMSTNSIQQEEGESERLERKCSNAVDKMVDLNINFLGIDFDQTMIDIHTGGRWRETVPELAEHMRPLFRRLVPLAASRGVRAAIVTFSPQTGHIREVLEHSFPASIAGTMPIRGNDGTWMYTGNGMRMGKQEHLASAAEELMARQALGVTDVRKETTLLIDDDPRNIRKCLKDGTRAVWFNPRDPNRLLDDILMLQ